MTDEGRQYLRRPPYIAFTVKNIKRSVFPIALRNNTKRLVSPTEITNVYVQENIIVLAEDFYSNSFTFNAKNENNVTVWNMWNSIVLITMI
jgi:hypothetical protein